MTFAYTMKARETTYRGTRFRSRLEARWAAFFDLCKWRWEYEPFDLNGWVPDFVLIGANEVLVEVKPVLGFEDGDEVLPGTSEKVRQAAEESEKEAVLLGACLMESPNFLSPALGMLCENPAGDWKDLVWSYASFIYVKNIDFCSDVHSYRGRLTDEYDGGGCVSDDCVTGALADCWAEAGNRTRWRRQ